MADRFPAAAALVCLALTGGVRAAQEQRPSIRSGVELLVVDAQVADRDGTPLLTLTPDDFEVTLDGRRRRSRNVALVPGAR